MDHTYNDKGRFSNMYNQKRSQKTERHESVRHTQGGMMQKILISKFLLVYRKGNVLLCNPLSKTH